MLDGHRLIAGDRAPLKITGEARRRLSRRPVPAPLLIADVPWLLYRSFFALPKSIVGADGTPVNALLGTVNALLSAEDALAAGGGARAIVACMGAEEATYRVALYPPYHAHREPMPPELRAQWGAARELLESFRWTYASDDQLEADDVMFSYARAEEARGGRALLITGDRDLYGAVSDSVSVLELRKGGAVGEIGPAQVRERYGVEPEQVADFIALRGDPSDGLPGARGIGAKTAAQLLRDHGNLETLLELVHNQPAHAAHALTPRTRGALLEGAEELRAFKQIATLQRIAVRAPRDRASDYAAGAEHAERLGMRALAKRLRSITART